MKNYKVNITFEDYNTTIKAEDEELAVEEAIKKLERWGFRQEINDIEVKKC